MMEQAEATLANLEIVRCWISAVNEKKLEAAERHSCADIEIVGPKGSTQSVIYVPGPDIEKLVEAAGVAL